MSCVSLAQWVLQREANAEGLVPLSLKLQAELELGKMSFLPNPKTMTHREGKAVVSTP